MRPAHAACSFYCTSHTPASCRVHMALSEVVAPPKCVALVHTCRPGQHDPATDASKDSLTRQVHIPMAGASNLAEGAIRCIFRDRRKIPISDRWRVWQLIAAHISTCVRCAVARGGRRNVERRACLEQDCETEVCSSWHALMSAEAMHCIGGVPDMASHGFTCVAICSHTSAPCMPRMARPDHHAISARPQHAISARPQHTISARRSYQARHGNSFPQCHT